MPEEKRINQVVVNTVSLIFARILQPLISFTIILLIARILGKKGLGEYSFILSYILLFQIIASLSFTNLVAREISINRNHSGHYLVNAGFVSLLFGIFLQIVLLVIIKLLAVEPLLSRAIFYTSFSIIASALIGVWEGIFTGHEKLYLVALTQTIENVTRATVSIILLLSGYGVFELMLVYLACRFLSFFIYSFLLINIVPKIHFRIDIHFVRSFLKKLQTFILIIVFVTIYWRLDILMLTKMDGTIASGIYSAAYRLFQIFIIIPQSFVYSLFPVIAKKFHDENTSLRETVERGIRYLLFFSIPMTIIMIILAKPLILLLYGEKFIQSVIVLKILMLTIIPYSITVMMGYTLVASNLQKYDMMINGASVLVNATLNYFLIHTYGYNGAAAATFLSICFYLIFQYPVVRRFLFHIHFGKYVFKPLAASILVGGGLYFLKNWNVFINFGIGIVFYVGILYILSYFDKDEKLYFKQLVLTLKKS